MKTRDLVICALFAAMTAILAQISIHMERMNAAGWWQAIQYAILQQPH